MTRINPAVASSVQPADVRDESRARSARLFRVAAVLVALGAAALTATACSSAPSSPGIASVGSTTSTTVAASAPPHGGSGTSTSGALKYAQCMRTHGFPTFPDPNSDGGFTDGPSNANPGNPSFVTANKACQANLGHGHQLSTAQEQEIEAHALRFAECMRSHGVPNYPDPTITFSDGGVSQGVNLKGIGLRPTSPVFQRAEKACQSISSGGAP